MKTTLLSFLFLLCFWANTATAQTPQSIAYQAIARNSAGNAIISAPVGIRASVLTGSATGTAVYVETHTPTTNSAGLFVLSLGLGAATTGTFSTIDWATGTKFLKIDIDVAGGTNYVTVGTTQLLSVPYALYADKVNPANLPTDKDQQNLSISGNSLSISGGNSVNLPASTDAQTLTLTGNTLSISGGNNVTLPTGGVPKVTNAQMFALPTPQLGDVVFNTDLVGFCYYKTKWKFINTLIHVDVITSSNATAINTFSNVSTSGGTKRYFSFLNGTVSTTAPSDFNTTPNIMEIYFSDQNSVYLQIGQNGSNGYFKQTTLTATDFNNADVSTLNNLTLNVDGNPQPNIGDGTGKTYEFINTNGKKGLLLINSYSYNSGTNTHTINISVKVQQ